MEARKLVENASLGPEALRVAYEAFDQAWLVLADAVAQDPVAVESTRLRLANVILSLVTESSRDAAAVRDAALAQIIPGYRRTPKADTSG